MKPNPSGESVKTRRQARKWVRNHWARFAASADLPDDPDMPSLAMEVWDDECQRIAHRLDPESH